MSRFNVEEFKKSLIEKRDDLLRLVKQKKELELSEAEVGDEADAATQSLEKEMLFELNDNERTMLDNIEASLRKIEKGQYGLCESCNKRIAMERLKAMPFARYCISCQSRKERPS